MFLVSKYPEAYIFYNENPKIDKYKADMVRSLKTEKPDIIVLNKEGTFRIKKEFNLYHILSDYLEYESKLVYFYHARGSPPHVPMSVWSGRTTAGSGYCPGGAQSCDFLLGLICAKTQKMTKLSYP